ncbi:MAG: transposase, partial [Desulfovibrio sp.]|nr:transposase [Desulfovibrio sp.]
MSILPAFLQPFVTAYLQPLLQWFSAWVYTQLVNREAQHLLVQLQSRLDCRPLEQACAAFHHAAGPGTAPTHTVPRLVRALLVKYLYDWSLRETETQVRFQLLVKWFVGYAVFEAGPDHTTLERFEQWVSVQHPTLFFDTVLRQIDAAFPGLRQQPQIGDTFALEANAAREDLVLLLRHTSRRLLRALQAVAPEREQAVRAGMSLEALFGPAQEVPGAFLTAWQRQARLHTVVTAVLHLLPMIQKHLEQPAPLPPEARTGVSYWLGHLQKILGDEVVIRDAPPALEVGGYAEHSLDALNAELLEETDPSDTGRVSVIECPRAEKGSYRLGSATDPEATYRVHGAGKTDFGYNPQIAITPEGVVREIQATPGAQPDSAGVVDLLTAQHDRLGVTPPKLIYDTAAGAGKTRARVAQATQGQTQLVAPLPPSEKASGRFGPEQFQLSPDEATLTCPNGQRSSVAYRSQEADGRTFRFFPAQCADCPLWAACRRNKVGPRAMRQVFLSDYRPEVEAARAYNQTPAFRADMKLRPRVERVI